jgi:hypothetical protein
VLTPTTTGHVKIRGSASYRSKVTSAPAVTFLGYGLGPLPGNNVTFTGTVLTKGVYRNSTSSSFTDTFTNITPVTFYAEITGLTLSQEYYFDQVLFLQGGAQNAVAIGFKLAVEEVPA